MKEKIMQSLSMRTVAEHYGLEINRSGFCKCSFHAEKTASMKIYEKSFYCYGCGKGGDLIKFVQLYHDLDFYNAMLKINDEFHLGLADKRFSKSEKSNFARLKQMNEKFEKWETETFIMLSECFRTLRNWHEKCAYPDERFIISLELMDRVEFLNSFFIENSSESKLEFFRYYRKEAKEIYERIQKLAGNR